VRVLYDGALLLPHERLPLIGSVRIRPLRSDETSDPFGDKGEPFGDDGKGGDPFGEGGGSDRFGDDGGKKGDPHGRKGRGDKRRLPPTRRLAYAAISAALSVVMITIAAWLPVTAAPLLITNISWNAAMEKCGFGYGLMSMIASVALGFLCSAANVAVLVLVAVVFVPYSLLCYGLSRAGVDYKRALKAVLRAVIIAAFGALEVLIVFKIAGALTSVGDYVSIDGIISFIAGGNFALGYFAVTLAVMVIFILVDLIYCYFFRRVLDKLK